MDLRLINGNLYHRLIPHSFTVKFTCTGADTTRQFTLNNIDKYGITSPGAFYIAEKITYEIPTTASASDIRLLLYRGKTPEAIAGWYTQAANAQVAFGNFPQRFIGLRVESTPALIEIDLEGREWEFDLSDSPRNRLTLSPAFGTGPTFVLITFEGYYARFIKELSEKEMFQIIMAGGKL